MNSTLQDLKNQKSQLEYSLNETLQNKPLSTSFHQISALSSSLKHAWGKTKKALVYFHTTKDPIANVTAQIKHIENEKDVVDHRSKNAALFEQVQVLSFIHVNESLYLLLFLEFKPYNIIITRTERLRASCHSNGIIS